MGKANRQTSADIKSVAAHKAAMTALGKGVNPESVASGNTGSVLYGSFDQPKYKEARRNIGNAKASGLVTAAEMQKADSSNTIQAMSSLSQKPTPKPLAGPVKAVAKKATNAPIPPARRVVPDRGFAPGRVVDHR